MPTPTPAEQALHELLQDPADITDEAKSAVAALSLVDLRKAADAAERLLDLIGDELARRGRGRHPTAPGR